MVELLQTAIAAYGLSTLIADYDGPFRIFFRLRRSRLGALFECNVCLLPYIAILCLVAPLWALNYLAVVGVGVILARLV
jgi:hypothetical protein